MWWGDERYVPADDAERNDGQARAALLDHVPVDPARVHEMPASDGGHDASTTPRRRTARSVRSEGHADRFDVVMLGVGPDGHVASLFPGYPQLDVEDVAVGGRRTPPSRRRSGSA